MLYDLGDFHNSKMYQDFTTGKFFENVRRSELFRTYHINKNTIFSRTLFYLVSEWQKKLPLNFYEEEGLKTWIFPSRVRGHDSKA